jgi:DNA modification methylase
METTIQTHLTSATDLSMLADASIDLVVTSPPYPMVKMWDDVFSSQDPAIHRALEDGQGVVAFERMHQILDTVWTEVYRVLKPGGTACINIGDATRTIDREYRLYANHARILTQLMSLGFSVLPDILWRKPTNAPNKFMGSGMLPAGAYVTYEHEYILVVRKGRRRVFATDAEKQRRRESAFFWEERNIWFSDLWSDITGTSQKTGQEAIHRRSGAFPFELAYRLINMFSIKQDTVLDPFVGTGTTLKAAMATGRHGIGVESDPQFYKIASTLVETDLEEINKHILTRLDRHSTFVEQRVRDHKPTKYINKSYGFPVMTRQEQALFFNPLVSIRPLNRGTFNMVYSDKPQHMDGT